MIVVICVHMMDISTIEIHTFKQCVHRQIIEVYIIECIVHIQQTFTH